MKKKAISKYRPNIRNSLFQTLLKRIPPKAFSPHLEDLVDALMDALDKGEVEIYLTKNHSQKQLNNPGWPNSHKEALLASGWLEGETSWGAPAAPLVLRDGSMLISDDRSNQIFKVTYKNTKN